MCVLLCVRSHLIVGNILCWPICVRKILHYTVRFETSGENVMCIVGDFYGGGYDDDNNDDNKSKRDGHTVITRKEAKGKM